MTETTAPDTRPYLVILGNQFECRPNASFSWEMMEYGAAKKRVDRAKRAHKNDDECPSGERCQRCKDALEEQQEATTDMMLSMRTLTLKALKPEERERFKAFMEDSDLEQGDFENALGEMLAAIGKQNDDKGKA